MCLFFPKILFFILRIALVAFKNELILVMLIFIISGGSTSTV